MNEIHLAAVLTPFLFSLIGQGVKGWYGEPGMTPLGLTMLGFVGKIYLLAIMVVVFAASISMLGLMILGNASFLSTLGLLILGYLSGGVFLATFSKVFAVSMFIESLVGPGLFAVNLVVAHYLAWSSF